MASPPNDDDDDDGGGGYGGDAIISNGGGGHLPPTISIRDHLDVLRNIPLSDVRNFCIIAHVVSLGFSSLFLLLGRKEEDAPCAALSPSFFSPLDEMI